MNELLEKLYAPIPAEFIKLRAARSSGGKTQFLAYKDARIDMLRLNEVFGPLGWCRSHTLVGDVNYCTISLFDAGSNSWVSKMDAGSESNIEKEKGEASDAFKRACFNLGIGIALYSFPNITLTDEWKFKANTLQKKIGYFSDNKTVVACVYLVDERSNSVVFKWEHPRFENASKEEKLKLIIVS